MENVAIFSIALSKWVDLVFSVGYSGCVDRGAESAVGFRVLEIQSTPNPNAAKIVLDRPVTQQPTSFFNASAAKDHPLASQLFKIDGVTSLLLLGDFITINKSPEADWDDITKRAQAVLGSVAAD